MIDGFSLVLFVLAVTNFTVLAMLYYVAMRVFRKDVLSPGALLVYFSALPATTMLWYSINQEALYLYVFNQINPLYHDLHLVALSYLLTTVGTIISFLGAVTHHRAPTPRLYNVFEKFFRLTYFGRNTVDSKRGGDIARRTGLAMCLVGLTVYGYFVSSIGGLGQLWENMYLRTTLTAGLQYYQVVYSIALIFGSLLVLHVCLLQKRYFVSAIIILIIVFIFSSLGQRNPVALYLFAVIVMYHYTISPIKIISFKYGFLVFALFLFMSVAVQFRNPEGAARYVNNPEELVRDSLNSIEQTVVARFGRLERDIVILGHFQDRPFWYGKSYLGIIVAPIPRLLYEDKPPIDTGVYLTAIASGYDVDPPVPLLELPSTSSMPENNWAGYMNFGLPGFIFLFFLSGWLLCFFYEYALNYRHAVGPVVIYAMFGWFGAMDLSPGGLVKAMITLLVLFFLSVLFRIRMTPRRRII